VEPKLIWLAGEHIVAPRCRTFLPHQAEQIFELSL
jgi:hypothetical protein